MTRILATTLGLLALAGTLFAQDPAPAPAAAPSKINVTVKPATPFAFEKNGQLVGYSIDLWNRVAEEADLQFDFKTVKTVPELLEALKTKATDAGVGALSVTAERESFLDFSHPIYNSGLQILVKPQGSKSVLSTFSDAFLRADVAKVIGLLILAPVLIAHLLWFVERRRNAESFPESYREGVIEATWWSVCTLIAGGCENKAPVGMAGRLLAIVWMLAGIGLVSYVTATLSANLTFDKISSDIKGLGDLGRIATGTVSGSSTQKFLEGRGLTVKGFDTLENAVAALEKGDVGALVYDEPLLRYQLSQSGGRLQLVGDVFDRHSYAFGLQSGSPHLKKINRALTRLREQGFFDELDKKWFAPAQ